VSSEHILNVRNKTFADALVQAGKQVSKPVSV